MPRCSRQHINGCNLPPTTVFWGQNRGEDIMNHILKSTAAALALTITLVGAPLVSAPMSLRDSQQVVAHAHQWSAGHFHRLASELRSVASSARA